MCGTSSGSSLGAVQMLLTMAANATKCSTFEVQYGKSTSTRTTASCVNGGKVQPLLFVSSPYSYLVDLGDGRVRHVHANKMRKFHVRVQRAELQYYQ